MIDELELIEAPFRRKHPTLTITRVVDYDSDYYLIEGVPDVNRTNVNGSWYSIDKDTEGVAAFSPMYDLRKFSEACKNRTMYSYKDKQK